MINRCYHSLLLSTIERKCRALTCCLLLLMRLQSQYVSVERAQSIEWWREPQPPLCPCTAKCFSLFPTTQAICSRLWPQSSHPVDCSSSARTSWNNSKSLLGQKRDKSWDFLKIEWKGNFVGTKLTKAKHCDHTNNGEPNQWCCHPSHHSNYQQTSGHCAQQSDENVIPRLHDILNDHLAHLRWCKETRGKSSHYRL